MRILLFHPWIKSKGGAEKLILEYTLRSRNDITILTWYYDKNKSFEEFKNLDIISVFPEYADKITRAFLFRGAFFGVVGNLFKVLKEDNFDLIFISTSGIAETTLLRINKNIPIVLYVHTPLRASYIWDIYWNLRYRFNNPIYKWVYSLGISIYNKMEMQSWKKVDLTMFNSELSLKRALDKNLIDINKTKVIYPGADLDNLFNGEPKNYFLYIGRFGMAKRQHILIKAFAKFIKEYKDYKLVLAGGLENKRYYMYLLKLVRELGLQKYVIIKPNLPYGEIVGLYAYSLAFIHIPYMEDFGIAPLEAAASGKYIINVYPSGNHEVLKDFPGIYWIKEKFYEEKMVEEVYKALVYFVRNKDELVEDGEENMKYIRKLDLSWDRFTREVDKTLEELIKK